MSVYAKKACVWAMYELVMASAEIRIGEVVRDGCSGTVTGKQ